jgi:DNA-binding NtrC family response regulator
LPDAFAISFGALQIWMRTGDAGANPDTPEWRQLLVGQSSAILEICDIIQLVAARRVTVLITGETGTGKEVVARAIHAASNRANFPMVAVNCTALPANLIESELFGHAKGAFTGAHMNRIGRFEQANRSSIFLDEIGDLPLEAQAKLLRVLQEQEFQRVGSSETVKVDVRVIAASNVDLEQAARERRFREDLYYRLNVVPIHMPPLRERREDIPLLLDHFMERIRAAENGPFKEISPEAVEFLSQLDWPGNVRQLEHTVQMAFALSGDRTVLYPHDFSVRRSGRSEPAVNTQRPLIVVPEHGLNFDEVVSSFERSLLNQALAVSGGNKAKAADLLRIKRTTLLAKLKSLEERENAKPTPASQLPAALIVEEDAAVRKLVAKTVEQLNYRALEAANQAAAFELFQCWKKHISLVVASQQEPGTNEFIGRLRAITPLLGAVIVADEQDAPVRYPQAEIVVRPFSSDEIVSAVKAVEAALADRTAAFCA